jgi:GNAT superfamily N-acetyltransferase
LFIEKLYDHKKLVSPRKNRFPRTQTNEDKVTGPGIGEGNHMDVPWVVRPITSTDFQQLQSCARRIWAHTYHGLLDEAVQEDYLSKGYAWEKLEAAMEEVRRSQRHFEVIELKGTLEGYCDLGFWGGADTQDCRVGEVDRDKIASLQAYLFRLYIGQELQGKGSGRLLLTRALNWAKSQGVSEVRTTVLRINHRARRFYEALGFIALDGLPLSEISVEQDLLLTM